MNNLPMKTNVVGLIKTDDERGFLYGEGKNYIIPEYQRAYSWGENEIESFVDSLKRAIDGEKEVFMGTVQFNCENDGLHIIDGQQRMTTLLLLCKVLETLSNQNIRCKNHMELEIRNFTSNKDKLDYALKDSHTDKDLSKDNRYLDNLNLLTAAVEELIKERKIDADAIMTAVRDKFYFVELVTKNFSLPQVVGIFNTINTTGMDLNSSDLFKLQYFEYLKRNYGDNNWMRQISDVYEDVNEKSYLMQDILDVYKHCIVAQHKLGWEKLSKSNESFFDEILGEKSPADKADILRFSEFKRIVEIYIDFNKQLYDLKSKNVFAKDVILQTRYGRYWTLPYVAAYFNGKDYISALKNAMTVAKYLVVCSVNFDRRKYDANKLICDTILPDLCSNKEIDAIVQNVPVRDGKDASSTFKERIRENLVHNARRARIVCTLSALLEELAENTSYQEIKAKLFDWKKFKYDIEHIRAREKFEKKDPNHIAEYNGIGNLVVLNSSINRSIKNDDVDKKVEEYENSTKYQSEPKFVSVMRVIKQIKDANKEWGINQVQDRCKKQEELLCKFLGLE